MKSLNNFFAAHIAVVIINWNEMKHASIQMCAFLFYFVLDMTMQGYNYFYDPYNRVGFISHLCGKLSKTKHSEVNMNYLSLGAIAGLLVGIGVLRNLKERDWQRKLWWIAITIYTLLMSFGISYNLIFFK